MTPQRTDTIAASAGAPGRGGIAILRVSGPRALQVLAAVFAPGRSEASAAVLDFRFRPRFLHYGQALGRDALPLDEVLAVFMPGPASATGEDVGEMHCHGGPGVVAALLDAMFAAGARPAGPGEFTRRAFLNGRMDLTAAEAVAEIIEAPTLEGVRLARAKLDGTFGRRIDSLRSLFDSLRAQAILAVDFPDEDAELLNPAAFSAGIAKARRSVDELLASYERASLWREGAVCLLAGAVNAGKSSLLNALLGRNRAIVSAQPGTTRDYIEETVNLAGLPVRLIDTAGLRETGDVIEAEGMRLTEELADSAQCVLLVVDAQKGPGSEEAAFLDRRPHLLAEGRVFLVWNKIDAAPGSPPATSPCASIAVSARTGEGISELAQAVRTALLHSAPPAPGDLAPNLRQADLLRRVQRELDALSAALVAGMPPDILTVHLDAAADLLAEITGKSGTEELLDRIFADFCIGK